MYRPVLAALMPCTPFPVYRWNIIRSVDIEPPKHQLLDTAQELGVAVISYSPLGNRLLSGTFQSKDDFTKPGDMRGSVPWFSDDNFQTSLSIVDKIGKIARSKGVTAAQLTLAWILSQEGDFFVIPVRLRRTEWRRRWALWKSP